MTLVHTSHLTDNDEINALRAISDERLTELLTKIRPVCDYADGLHYLQPPEFADIRTTAFRWSPVRLERVDLDAHQELGVITTYHSCAYHMLFKPDLAETLAQIPADLVDRVVAVDVLFDHTEMVHGTFYGHKTFTRLYGKV